MNIISWSPDLSEGVLNVGHGAEDEGYDDGVERFVLKLAQIFSVSLWGVNFYS